MIHNCLTRTALLGFLLLMTASYAGAQSGSVRPRRVNSQSPASTADTTEPVVSRRTDSPSDRNSSNGISTGSANTSHAYSLLQQKQYAAAATEAKQIAAQYPEDAEAWKIAGFAEYNLKQYDTAASDLRRALDLQRKANQEDPNTVDALAQSFVFNKQFDQALPLLVTATARKGTPDAEMLYFRGLAEYKTGKTADAERSFNAAVKTNPKNSGALFYLGEIAYKRNDLDAAINAFNRATSNDPRVAAAWELLTASYLKRADTQTNTAKADADFLGAVRAAEGLNRLQSDERASTLYARALIGAKQYQRAAAQLERNASSENATGSTLYLLGFAYVNSKNYPKAINALERAAIKTPEDVNIYRLLGYSYEVSKQYTKALASYQKGAQLAPSDTDLKEAIDRVKPFAK